LGGDARRFSFDLNRNKSSSDSKDKCGDDEQVNTGKNDDDD